MPEKERLPKERGYNLVVRNHTKILTPTVTTSRSKSCKCELKVVADSNVDLRPPLKRWPEEARLALRIARSALLCPFSSKVPKKDGGNGGHRGRPNRMRTSWPTAWTHR